MGIAEGTTLGILTIASLIFVWAAIRDQEKEHERAQQRGDPHDEHADQDPASRS